MIDLKENMSDFQRLHKDVKEAVRTVNPREARYLVDMYYTIQNYRISGNNQVRSMTADSEPHATLDFFSTQMTAFENQIKRVLKTYAESQALGVWAMSNVGIGPVITAGFLAHIDLNIAVTAGHIWRYAGLDPTQKWVSSKDCAEYVRKAFLDCDTQELAIVKLSEIFGLRIHKILDMVEADWKENIGVDEDEEKNWINPLNAISNSLDFTINNKIPQAALARKLARRPWNADLKTLCWKAGESFVKVCNKEDAFYGKVYIERKELEIERNNQVVEVSHDAVLKITPSMGSFNDIEKGEVAVYLVGNNWFANGNAKAAQIALQKNIGKDTDAYASYITGKLPPAHIHSRAKRYAVKMFLSHYHEVGRIIAGLPVPNPYAIEHLGHVHRISPPNFESI